ncbi:Kazal-type serine protease inhibitor domain-containing protein [Aminobacter sp. HY435]|uniref:Kazal-type serine protease inhibitor domain-containing protein n=1 Tax=Aminobacter sp. HY435 TaxID=2970917 RepID=UPI0022B94C34|nr:Kazal-type serine protease inhibitor domain-containing protein [Aminobacter sp. HY435]
MNLPARSLLRKAALASLISVVLASCTVVVDEGPGPRPPRPGPGPQFCTREYDPVCARRGDDRQTFANGCMAEAAGYRIIRGGQCRGDNGGWDGGNGGGNPQFCTREYRPVCAQRGGSLRTFPNACEADSAGFRVVDRGPC